MGRASRNVGWLLVLGTLAAGCDSESSGASCEDAAAHIEGCGITTARTNGTCSEESAEQILALSCDELSSVASSNAKADEAFGSWECLQFGICPEVASAAIAVTAGAVAVPGLVVGPARVGERSNSQECVQACEDAYAHYKNVCHEPTCVAQTSFSSDAERQNYCSQTRAKFYENAECALARFDYGGFCQIAKNFTPNQEHQYPINRSLNKAQECANAYATACGGSLSFPNGSLKYADLYNSCI